MKKETKRISYLFIRYLVLVLLALGGFWLIYAIFTPLTVYPVYFFLKIFFHTTLSFSIYDGLLVPIIALKGLPIVLVPACIAGSAYYLLLILNLATPMPSKTRFYSIIFSLLSFLVINILRIFFFSIILINSFSIFNTLHLIFWYFLSSLLVFGIWLATIKLFKIDNIPIYTDLKYLYKNIK